MSSSQPPAKPSVDNRRKLTVTLMGALTCLVGIGVVACGGGSSGAATTSATGTTATTTGTSTTSGYPVAPPPTCTSVVRRSNIQTEASIRAHAHGNFRVPASSVETPADVGVRAHTNTLVNTNPVPAVGGPQGMTPSQVLTAYNIPANGGSGAIAVVEAYDYPQALSDFNVFSSQFNLPTESSTNPTASSNPVLQVVYAGGSEPRSDPDWAQETALDAQWAHALAPKAKIFIVEAASSNLSDLMTAVSVAKALPNVRQVSMSFGSAETGCNYVDYDSTFIQQGVSFFVAAGDSPGTISFPPGSSNVIAVGGTTLNTAPDGTWISETAWDDTGCGPSFYEPRPPFQNVVAPTVGEYRGVCDIAAVGDPNTGLSVYDSFPDQGSSGWIVLGGTSAATPVIAGIANTSGVSRTSSVDQNTHFYSALGSSSFHDITSGTAGSYKAGAGYDFPTGGGTPNGMGGF